MTLLVPLALALLAALPLIVILHLIRDRRPRVPVSSLLLWRNLKHATAGPRRRRLPLTLLLLVQLALAALLAFALAQPQWSLFIGPGTHTIVLIDTSASMAASDVRPSRLDAAREEARQVLDGLRGNDTATLIGMGPHAERLGSAGASGRGALAARLAALVAGGVNSDIAGAIALAGADVDARARNRILVLTDGAFPTADLANLPPALAPITWRMIGGAAANDAIIALSAAPIPDGRTDLFARVAHYGGEPGTREVELRVDGRQADRRVLNFQADSDTSLNWTVPAGASTVELALLGSDALAADDRGALSLLKAAPQRALLVAGTQAGGDALERALRAQDGLQVTRLPAQSYDGQAADLTVFEHYLPPRWPAGGGVLLVSPPGDDLANVALATGGSERVRGTLQWDPGDALMRGVDLSGTRFGNVAIVEPGPGMQTVAYAGARALILRAHGTPPMIVLAFDLAGSNLPERVSFPLLVANAVTELTPPPLPPSVLAGEPVTLGALDAQRVLVTTPDGVTRPIDERTWRDTLQPGLYTLAITRADGSARTERFAVLSGSPRESDLRPHSLVSLSVRQNPVGTSALAAHDLWPWLAGAALLALGMEGWLRWRR